MPRDEVYWSVRGYWQRGAEAFSQYLPRHISERRDVARCGTLTFGKREPIVVEILEVGFHVDAANLYTSEARVNHGFAQE